MLGGRSEAGVRKALQRLAASGLVAVERVGRAYTYSLNRDHVLADHVIAIAQTMPRFVAEIRTVLQGWAVPCSYAAVYGSAARGQMGPDSDVDLIFVRPDAVLPGLDEWQAQVTGLEELIRLRTGNDAQVLELSEQEVRRALDRPVLREIRRDAISVFGDASVIARGARG